MDSVIELIRQNSSSFPEFNYYIPLIEKAQNNVSIQPDICIEICKSLLEGVSKSIIEKLPNSYTREDLDKLEVGPLVKLAAKELKRNDDVVEDDFVTRCSSLAYALAALRNARGDISHGKAAPKLKQSNAKLSTFSIQMTASILHYMLDAFFIMATEAPEEETGEKSVRYEDNPEFNTYLDDENPLEGRVLYSLALYEQYYEDYLIKLSDYEYEMELEEEI